MDIRPVNEADRSWMAQLWSELWGSARIVVHGLEVTIDQVEGAAAWEGDQLLGLVTYMISGDTCEIITLNALAKQRGIGSALLAAAVRAARQAGCRLLHLVTSNDNLDALRFYQKRGLRLWAVRPGALDEARAVKPEIPLVGDYGIPLHDEIELRLDLSGAWDNQRQGEEIG